LIAGSFSSSFSVLPILPYLLTSPPCPPPEVSFPPFCDSIYAMKMGLLFQKARSAPAPSSFFLREPRLARHLSFCFPFFPDIAPSGTKTDGPVFPPLLPFLGYSTQCSSFPAITENFFPSLPFPLLLPLNFPPYSDRLRFPSRLCPTRCRFSVAICFFSLFFPLVRYFPFSFPPATKSRAKHRDNRLPSPFFLSFRQKLVSAFPLSFSLFARS